MGKYILKRVLKGLLTLLITVTVTFLLVRLMPSNPVDMVVDPRMSAEQRELMMERFGLNGSLFEQYTAYLGNLLQGDLGTSFTQSRAVTDIIMECLPWTLLLMLPAHLLSMSLGIPLGIFAGYRRGSRMDQLINAAAIVGISLFVPWVGFSLLYNFGYQINIFPIGGAITPGIKGGFFVIFQDVFMHMVLPMVTLMIIYFANYVLYTRGSIIDVLGEDYIRTARSKGMTETRVLRHHAAKNAMIPTITVAGMSLGAMVGGAVLTETVYAYPGVGRMIYTAVSQQDYPVLQGCFIVLAINVITINIITDIICAYLDPRIKLN